jgi:hypothetical protein
MDPWPCLVLKLNLQPTARLKTPWRRSTCALIALLMPSTNAVANAPRYATRHRHLARPLRSLPRKSFSDQGELAWLRNFFCLRQQNYAERFQFPEKLCISIFFCRKTSLPPPHNQRLNLQLVEQVISRGDNISISDGVWERLLGNFINNLMHEIPGKLSVRSFQTHWPEEICIFSTSIMHVKILTRRQIHMQGLQWPHLLGLLVASVGFNKSVEWEESDALANKQVLIVTTRAR